MHITFIYEMTAAIKMHVKKGDTVLVLSGKDKGKEGKIIEALPKKAKVVVEGVNKVKRHTKPSQANPQGGIITLAFLGRANDLSFFAWRQPKTL